MTGFSFFEYLHNLPHDIVFRHLLSRKQGRKIVSSSMLSSVAEEFTSSDAIQKRFFALDSRQQLTLSLIMLFEQPGFPAQAFDDFDDPLLQTFFVGLIRDRENRLWYRCFHEFTPTLREYCIASVLKHCTFSGSHDARWFFPGYCLNDIAVLFMFALQGSLRMTKEGRLTKSAEALCRRVLHAASVEFVESRSCIELCIDFCIEQNLLYLHDRNIKANIPVFEAWLRLPEHLRRESLKSSLLAAVSGVKVDMVNAVCTAASERWIHIASFPEPVKVRACNLGETLVYTGDVEYSRQEGDLLFRFPGKPAKQQMNRVTETAPKTVVLPDFSVMIPQECRADELYRFAHFGTMTSLDQVYKGTVKQATIHDSLSRAVTEDALLEWVRELRAPENVFETVREWIREFFRVALFHQSFLVTNDSEIGRQLESVPELSDSISRVEAKAVFVVQRGREHHVRNQLASMGFDSRAPVSPTQGALPGRVVEPPQSCSWTLVTSFSHKEQPGSGLGMTFSGGKYGAAMKKLDITDIIKVIDYALTMQYILRFRYRKDSGRGEKEFRVVPLRRRGGKDPILEGKVVSTNRQREFCISNILEIGVEPS